MRPMVGRERTGGGLRRSARSFSLSNVLPPSPMSSMPCSTVLPRKRDAKEDDDR